MSGTSLAQRVMPLLGAFYVVIGIIGFFITGFSNFVQNTGDELIGFAINPFHNTVHLAIGAFLIIMSRQATSSAEGACLGVGLFYITAFVIGVIGVSNLTILSMYGRGDLENFNHLLFGVVLLGLGLMSSGATESEAKRRGITAY
ncbi:MAG: hypothetical protein QOJ35_2698 [Solirubrobacteraceae bacterium]|nr:hypothetical protein [Solirubrobacteraceae bacterium]